MNKVIPFVFVVAFWGLFYFGNKGPNAGETIAILAVICLVMLLLYSVKSYLLKKIMNNNKEQIV